MLASSQWDIVHVVVRKPGALKHAKLNEIVIPDLNFAQDPQLAALAQEKHGQIDAAVVTLGVNEAFGWTPQQLLDVELILTNKFSEYCHAKLNVPYISILTMEGTERGYSFTSEELEEEITYWNIFEIAPRVKGQIEQVVLDSGIPYCTFFHPSNFETDEYRFGTLDVVLQNLFWAINWMLPANWRSVHVKDLAHAMVADAERVSWAISTDQTVLLQHDNIKSYADFFGEAVGPKPEL